MVKVFNNNMTSPTIQNLLHIVGVLGHDPPEKLFMCVLQFSHKIATTKTCSCAHTALLGLYSPLGQDESCGYESWVLVLSIRAATSYNSKAINSCFHLYLYIIFDRCNLTSELNNNTDKAL